MTDFQVTKYLVTELLATDSLVDESLVTESPLTESLVTESLVTKSLLDFTFIIGSRDSVIVMSRLNLVTWDKVIGMQSVGISLLRI